MRVQRALLSMAVLALIAAICRAYSADAAFNGRNGVIAYEDTGAGSEGLPSVWTVEASGRRERLFKSNATHPAFSPDGRQLAYVRGAGVVMLARADGRGHIR